MKLCTQCVLPETFPSINFDADGVCNYCRNFKGIENFTQKKRKHENRFLELVRDYRGKNDYDVLMAYSGGKDSTYTLSVLKDRYKLNILALTFDNGFISPYAFENIKNVVEYLSIDHIIIKPRFDLLRKIFAASVTENIYSAKTLERASTICTSCMGLVKFITLKLSLEKRIPFIGYGWSPGQAPVESSVMKVNPSFIITTQKAIFDPLFKIGGNDIVPYFLNNDDFNKSDYFPYNIHPLAFLDYDEDDIIQKIKRFGWNPPQDTDSNSTNCLLNSFANKIHKDKYHFHPYAFEIAALIRCGVMKREDGIAKIGTEEDPMIIRHVAEKLQFDS